MRICSKEIAYLFCLTLTFLVTWGPLLGEEPFFSVETELHPSILTLDDEFQVSVTLKYPPSHRPDTLLLTQNLLRTDKMEDYPFSLVDQEMTPTQIDKENLQTTTFIYTLEPWKEGNWGITFRYVRFVPIDSSKDKVVEKWTKILPVEITPSNSQAKTVFDLRLLPPPGSPLLELNSTLRQKLSENPNESQRNATLLAKRTFPWGTFVFLTFLLIGGWLARRPLKEFLRKLFGKVIPPINFQEKALKDLQKLKEKNYPEQEFFEKYYVVLTEIVRRYIEEAYHINAPEHTTEEFLQEASQHPSFPVVLRDHLAHFLEKADLVKFARQKTSLAECDEAFEAARHFIIFSSNSK